MQLVDSHCHLDRVDLTPYEGRLDGVIEAAKEAGVAHILCVCIDLENFPAVLAIAEAYDHIDASVGVHPNEKPELGLQGEALLERLVALADHPKIIAIGETGLDYYRTKEAGIEAQQDQFRMHIRAAKQTDKPLIIHTRQAREDTIRILKEEGADSVGGVLHCFTEDWETAKQGMALGFYVSFSGIVTFKNAKELQEVAKRVPLDRMLIETDAPYLSPVPHRGKSNEPAYVRHVAEFLAELRGVSLDEIASQTSKNFFRCFKPDIRIKD